MTGQGKAKQIASNREFPSGTKKTFNKGFCKDKGKNALGNHSLSLFFWSPKGENKG